MTISHLVNSSEYRVTIETLNNLVSSLVFVLDRLTHRVLQTIGLVLFLLSLFQSVLCFCSDRMSILY